MNSRFTDLNIYEQKNRVNLPVFSFNFYPILKWIFPFLERVVGYLPSGFLKIVRIYFRKSF